MNANDSWFYNVIECWNDGVRCVNDQKSCKTHRLRMETIRAYYRPYISLHLNFVVLDIFRSLLYRFEFLFLLKRFKDKSCHDYCELHLQNKIRVRLATNKSAQ